MKKAGPTRRRISLTSLASATLLLMAGGAVAAPPASDTQGVALTSSEMLTAANDDISQMQSTLRKVSALTEVAKKQKDIIRLNCVNNSALQIKTRITLAEANLNRLNEGIGHNDLEGAAHDAHLISILQQKVLVMGSEAQNCVGEDLSYIGSTSVTLDVDPLIPSNDPTEPGFPSLDTSRPPSASPTS